MAISRNDLLLIVSIQLMVSILRNACDGLVCNLVHLHGYFSVFASVALGLRNWQFLSKVNAVGLKLFLNVSWRTDLRVQIAANDFYWIF